ncbi:MAG: flagellin, partial [Vicinamibacterales bacterium]
QLGLDAIARAFDRTTNAQAAVGNDLRAVEDWQLRTLNDRTGVIARLSTIEDADLAEAAAKLAQSDTAYQAALQSLALIGRVSLMDYLK